MSRRRRRSVFSSREERHPVRNFFRGVLIALLLLVLIIVVGNYGIVNSVELVTATVSISDLPDDLENWSILVFSDLHGREIGTRQSAISNAIGKQNVSCVVLAGDMFGEDGSLTAVLDLIALCPSDKPILYVPGDEDPNYLDATPHNNLTAKAEWAVKLENAGVTILDRPVLYTRGTRDKARIWFIPADLYTLDLDAYEALYQAQIDRYDAQKSLTAAEVAACNVAEYEVKRMQECRELIASIQPGDIQIAVTHVPVSTLEISGATASNTRDTVFSLRQADLIIAGHYCAGQVRLPLLGAVYVPELGWWPDDSQIVGLNRINGVVQYISPGLGSSSAYDWWQRNRFMNKPTVTRITLTSKYK